MAKKKQNRVPLVTSVSTTLRQTVQSTQVVSKEEVKERKKDMLGVLDKTLEVFKKNLAAGKVEINSAIDLERIIKLTLLLSGEPDSVTGKSAGEQEQETTITAEQQGISSFKIDEVINMEDENVKELFDKLYKGMNEANDVD